MAFPTGWGHKIPIIIDHLQVGSDLTDWTVVFDQNFNAVLTSVNGPLDADGTRPMINGGDDIRFSLDSAGATQLAVDIRTGATNNDPTLGELELAVKIPLVSSSVDTTIYMWWGKPGEAKPAPGSTYGQYNAYDSHHKGIWDNSGSNANDRLGVNDLVNTNVTTGVSGKVGKAFSYNGTNSQSKKTIPIGLSLSIYTYEFLFRPTNNVPNGSTEQPLAKDDANGSSNFVWSYNHGNSSFQKSTAHKSGTTWYKTKILSAMSGGNWYHVGGQYNGSQLKVIFDGAFENPVSVSTPSISNGALAFGSGVDASYTNCLICEVRISDNARSDDWINANYKNQFNISGFLTFQPIEDIGTVIKNIFVGTSPVSKIYRGTDVVQKVYQGSTLIWEN